MPVIKHCGIRLALDTSWPREFLNSFLDGSYERDEFEVLKTKLSPGDTVMELGAGIGFLSAYCAKALGSHKVFAYEANPELAGKIRQTYELNKVSPSATIAILDEAEGSRELYVAAAFNSSSLYPKSTTTKCPSVPALPLNAEIKKHNPSFLIVDIEGAEYETFQQIDFHNIRKILIEFHPRLLGEEKVLEIKERLRRAGFSEAKMRDNVKIYYAEKTLAA